LSNPDQLAALAQRVATHVRNQIPRSSNRYHDPKSGATDWLHAQEDIEYTDFLLTISRIKSQGADTDKVTKKNFFCMFTQKAAKVASVSELKDAVLGFLRKGQVDGHPVDLGYKPGKDAEKGYRDAEKEYSKKFGAALADYLNAEGFRKAGAKFTAEEVMFRVRMELLGHDRSEKVGAGEKAVIKALNVQPLPLPLSYLGSSAKNAFKFGIGNCEECGCAAFAMLLTLSTDDGKPITNIDEANRVPIELLYASVKSDPNKDPDSHFFVLLNRCSARDVQEDFSRWIDDPTVIACDPWIIDGGVGGKVTSTSKGIQELRAYLKPDQKTLKVRRTGFLGNHDGLKDHPGFHLPPVSV